MPKFFVVSDIHGYYTELRQALTKAGFDETNENHWLISCGDHFDRGDQPIAVMKYLMGLPRKILIKGNHESLFDEMCDRGYPDSHDISNGTSSTIAKLGYLLEMGGDWPEACDRAYKRTRPFFNEMKNYFETKNYIFVHSWIPTLPGENWNGKPWYTQKRYDIFNPNWRNANQVEWDNAMWGNPFKQAAQGLLPDKNIVFGHWHCSAGWAEEEHRTEFGDNAKWDIYEGTGKVGTYKNIKFIGIDKCTAYTKEVNVLVIEDDFMEEPNEKES